MKGLYYIILFGILIFGLELHAQTADSEQGCFPLSVDFTSPAGSASYFWDFDDGATSTLSDPSHTFIAAGSFVVAFSSSAGGPVIGTVVIDVYPPPTPTFSSDVTQGCAPLSVNFENTTTLSPGITISSYSWVFGDGGTDSGANASHVFSGVDSYSVSLGLTTNLPSCDVTNLVPDFIETSDAPMAAFSTVPNPPIFCETPASISLINNTTSQNSVTYSWDFGNGETSTQENPSPQTYTEEGSYTIELIATDNTGCAATDQVLVSVGQPTASFYIPDTLCLGVPTFVENLSPAGNYTWNFGSGASPTSSSLPEPEVVFSTAGLHDITLTINGNCPDDTTITVFVQDVSALFTSDPSYSCENPMEVNFTPLVDGLDYEWTFDGGDTSTDQNPSYTYMVEDTTTYSINGPHDDVNYFTTTLIVTNPFGCSDTYSLVDTIHEPNALAFPDVVDGCSPLEVQFTDASSSNEDITEWEFVFGDGTSITSSNGMPESHTYTATGEYEFYIAITNDAGCKDTSYTHLIEVGEPLAINFSASPTEVCPGEEVLFTNLTSAESSELIDAWHYYTEESTMFHCFQEDNASWSYTTLTGPQDVTLAAEYNGCYSEITYPGMVNVLGPVAEINFECGCDDPFQIEFFNDSHGELSVFWDFGDGETSTESDPIHIYDATGDYTVTLQAINNATGCESSFDTHVVMIRDIQSSLLVPEVACQGIEVPLIGFGSQDVHAECYKGYTYSFSDADVRPITVGQSNTVVPFPNTGTLEVTLEVTDVNGCTDTTSDSIEIYGIQADFAISSELPTDQICFPTNVSFNDLSSADTTIVDWSWQFGDGAIGSGVPVDHTYASEDDVLGIDNFITVLLEVTDSIGCTDSQQYTIDYYSPISDVSVSDNSICSGDSISFTATDFTSMGSNLDFDWEFGDGSVSNLQNPALAYLSAGTYDVNMVFEEMSSGCLDSTQLSIQVADYPLAGFMSAVDSMPVICPNENVVFNDTSIFSGGIDPIYDWDFGNGSGSSFPDPGTFFAANGTYTVELIVEVPAPFGCADTASQEYTVYGPFGGFSTDIGDDAICRLDEVLFTIDADSDVDTFYWDFGDGVIAPGVSPISHQYDFVPPSGQTFASMIMSNADGTCPVVDEVPINIHEVKADFIRNINDIDTAICFQPYPLENTSLNGTVFYWDFGDGTTSAIENPVTHAYNDPGTYMITLGVLNDEWGCTDTIAKGVVLHPLPDLSATGDTICEGEIGHIDVLDPHPIWDYQWITNSSFTIDESDEPSTTSQPASTSSYTVIVTDTNFCAVESTVPIVVFNPVILPDFETIVPLGDTVFFPITLIPSLYDYVWEPDDVDNTCLDCQPPWVQVFSAETYTVMISDVEGCFTTDVEFKVDVHPETFVTMPTTFTPNGDGVNDIIYLEGWGVKELIEFKIFNRWGEMVFESNHMNIGWDGYHKGVLQNNDVYVYKVKALTWVNELKSLEGHINLMR